MKLHQCHSLLCFTILVLYGVTLKVKGENCQDMTGKWYNSLGSEFYVTHHNVTTHTWWGQYRTAAEVKKGSAGSTYSTFVGAAPYTGKGATFSWSVSWRDGISNTVWTGECAMCEGEEVIMSSWVLRSMQDTCKDVWKSVLIGQDFFTRHERAEGPRRHLGTNIPGDVRRKRFANSQEGTVEEMETIALEDKMEGLRSKREAASGSLGNCSIMGTWYNELGSKITIEPNATTNTLQGVYVTERERKTGRASGHHSLIHGLYSAEQPNRTMSMMVAWRDGASVTGWVAQCHVCSHNNDDIVVLEATWIHRYQVENCRDEWKSTFYGRNSFFRQNFKPVDGDTNVYSTFGEDLHSSLIVESKDASCSLYYSLTLLVITLFIHI